jgi:hypothetical protein
VGKIALRQFIRVGNRVRGDFAHADVWGAVAHPAALRAGNPAPHVSHRAHANAAMANAWARRNESV